MTWYFGCMGHVVHGYGILYCMASTNNIQTNESMINLEATLNLKSIKWILTFFFNAYLKELELILIGL